ncbi:KH domain-containing protein [Cryptosporidium muris RN66]|uniref:KH domain-containing protein n=1 Tax=Cryptosporidium muris (strain RN66) TaxID=441375 RepID=B6AK23_CRYMR|nr:KH domain-containing protein [Cryptosporidium muris RN66]EEA08564.1 KH domain-containing protein [Cryptosporidium muris RN66]|eukprot:XP_002142913.1 KH domain-containing protein [Cryptosporidium muris RN66]
MWHVGTASVTSIAGNNTNNDKKTRGKVRNGSNVQVGANTQRRGSTRFSNTPNATSSVNNTNSSINTANYKHTKKIPIDKSKFHPSISNLAGAIIGVSGANQKWMERESGAQVQILGTTPNDPDGLHIMVRYNEPREVEVVEAIIDEIGRATFEGGGGFISHMLPARKLATNHGYMSLPTQDLQNTLKHDSIMNVIHTPYNPVYSMGMTNVIGPPGGWPQSPPSNPVEFEWIMHLVIHTVLQQVGISASSGIPMIHLPMLYERYSNFNFEHDAITFFHKAISDNGLLGLIQSIPHVFIEGPHTRIDTSTIPQLPVSLKINLASGLTPLLLPAQLFTTSFHEFKLADESYWASGILPPHPGPINIFQHQVNHPVGMAYTTLDPNQTYYQKSILSSDYPITKRAKLDNGSSLALSMTTSLQTIQTSSEVKYGQIDIPLTNLTIAVQGIHFLLRRWIWKRQQSHLPAKSPLDFLPLESLEAEFIQFFDIPLDIELLGWTNLLHFVEAFPDIWTVENVGPDEFTLIPLPHPDFISATKKCNTTPSNKKDSLTSQSTSKGSTTVSTQSNSTDSCRVAEELNDIIAQLQNYLDNIKDTSDTVNSPEILAIHDLLSGLRSGTYQFDDSTSSALVELLSMTSALAAPTQRDKPNTMNNIRTGSLITPIMSEVNISSSVNPISYNMQTSKKMFTTPMTNNPVPHSIMPVLHTPALPLPTYNDVELPMHMYNQKIPHSVQSRFGGGNTPLNSSNLAATMTYGMQIGNIPINIPASTLRVTPHSTKGGRGRVVWDRDKAKH